METFFFKIRLEESFLHNQSSSTRKTVEFVVERVASVGIKHLIHDVVPHIKKTAMNELKSYNHLPLVSIILLLKLDFYKLSRESSF